MSARIVAGVMALAVAATILTGCENPSSKCGCSKTLKDYKYAGQSQLCDVGDGVCTEIWAEHVVDGATVKGYKAGRDEGVVTYKNGTKHWLFFSWTYQDKEQPCKDFHQLCQTPSESELHTDTFEKDMATIPNVNNASAAIGVFLLSFVTAAAITAGLILAKRRSARASLEIPYVPI